MHRYLYCWCRVVSAHLNRLRAYGETVRHAAPVRASYSGPNQDSAGRPDCAIPSRSSSATWVHVWPDRRAK